MGVTTSSIGTWTRYPKHSDSGTDPLPVRLSYKHIKPILRSIFKRVAVNAAKLATGNARMTEEEMRKRLEILRIEHRDLDAAIDALTLAGSSDQLQIARLKKRKLMLKDQIAMIEDYLIPDIIA
jgi:hypothetical protein